MPVVSIYIPTYKPKPDHLRAAIECALAQTFTDWELVVRDDASPGVDVEPIVRDYLKDPRITYYRGAQRRGIGGNWNACLGFGSGEFVAYLFQDDLWHPDYLKRSVEILRANPRTGFTAAEHEYLIEEGTHPTRAAAYQKLRDEKKAVLKPGHNDRMEFLQWWIERGLRPNVIGEPSYVLLRRSVIQAAGPFREDMPQGLDVEYWLRALLQADWHYIPDDLGEFRVHGAAASTINDELGHGLFDRLSFFDVLLRYLTAGPVRTLTARSLRRQFALMAGKFFGRVRSGGKVGGGGAGSLVSVVLRHPILVLLGMLDWATGRTLRSGGS